MTELILELDKALLLTINGSRSGAADLIMYWLSNVKIWIPLYLFIIGLIIYLFGKKSIPILLSLSALILLTDAGINYFIKHQVQRLRPCHNPELQELLQLMNDNCGGKYGFVSNHASNTFGLAVFTFLLLPSRFNWFKYSLLAWAISISYSRVYLGVHYPSDVLTGGLIGATIAYFVFRYTKTLFKPSEKL